MRRLSRFLTGLLLVLFVLALAFWYGGRSYLARSVAKETGSITLAGLGAPVEILFDARGVPQVYAKTNADARFALGWLHASERLFQMELTRRMARGQLSELFGPIAKELDAAQRRLGFDRQTRRDLASLDPTVKRELDEYVAGVNAWVAQAKPLPPEFTLLGFAPAPWTAEDVTLVGFYQSWFALTLMDRGADYREIFNRLGGDASRLAAAVQAWSPPTVPSAVAAIVGGAPKMTKASNSWVVAPAHSKSGGALHASDPHLELSSAPGLWYVVGLHTQEGLDAVGVTAPGIPAISMGHNGTISWAFTVAPIDLVDETLEIIEGAETDTPRVRTAEGWADVTVQVESITVKGEAPMVERVLRTSRGPVMELRGDTARVMHWAGYDFPAWGVVVGAGSLVRAKDFAAFRTAVTMAGALSVNWTYADKAGNIGYQLGAPLPERGAYDTFTPQRGTDSAAAWRGYRMLAQTPFALNPAQGWIATTNSQVVDASWPYTIPGFYNVARKIRASALLSTATTDGARTDAAAMTAMQMDLISGNAVKWKSLAAAGARSAGDAAVAARLEQWNGAMTANDTVASLFAYWWARLPRELFEDELGEAWGKAATLVPAVLSDSAAAFVDDARTATTESLDAISARAMRAALAEPWQRPFGAVQTLTIRHPLASVPALDRWLRLTRGPFPSGGDDATLNAAFVRFDTTTRTFHNEAGPSMRFVMDWADIDGFTLSRHLGQSGNPFSPHFDDFLAPHLAGEPWPLPFSRSRVESRAVNTLRLVPAPQ